MGFGRQGQGWESGQFRPPIPAVQEVGAFPATDGRDSAAIGGNICVQHHPVHGKTADYSVGCGVKDPDFTGLASVKSHTRGENAIAVVGELHEAVSAGKRHGRAGPPVLGYGPNPDWPPTLRGRDKLPIRAEDGLVWRGWCSIV